MARKIAVMRYVGDGARFHLYEEGGPEDIRPNYLHGAKYGNGGFTGQRCMTHLGGPYQGKRVFFRRHDHLNRLFNTVEALEWMKMPWTEELLEDVMCRLMVANQDDNYFSLVFSSGGDVGVKPKAQPEHLVFINSRRMDAGAYLGERILRDGMIVRVTEPDIRRGPPGKLTRAKVAGNYAISNVAKERADKAGADDAFIRDNEGHGVSELTVANVVCMHGERGTLITPDASSGPLESITRRTIMTLAEQSYGHECKECPIPLLRLPQMRMMIACGTAIGAVRITKVIEADGSTVWEQDPGDQ